jgi:NADH-quinone oxidoreductase subunit C
LFVSRQVLEKLKAHLGDALLDSHDHRGDETAILAPEKLRETVQWLRDTPGLEFDMLTDLTAVDYLDQGGSRAGKGPRFEVVYQLYSVSRGHRLRLKIGVDLPDEVDDNGIANPVVDTISDLYGNANWTEREVWDLYGIRFTDHPDPRRILMYDEFIGHPLRKDYRIDRRQPLIRRPRKELEEVVLGRGVGNKRSLI